MLKQCVGLGMLLAGDDDFRSVFDKYRTGRSSVGFALGGQFGHAVALWRKFLAGTQQQPGQFRSIRDNAHHDFVIGRSHKDKRFLHNSLP